MKLAAIFSALVLALAACGGSTPAAVSPGDGEGPAGTSPAPGVDTDTHEPQFDPCLDKAEGDACHVCDPAAADCVESQEEKACNADGQCVSATS